MTIEDHAHGYSILKDAILGGFNIKVNPEDDYDVGMHYAYAALKDLILDFEECTQHREATRARAYDRFRAWLSGYNNDDHLSVFDICEQLDRYERED